MKEVPVPRVTRTDVLRVVRREFPERDPAEIVDTLDHYGTEEWQPDRNRVQLAILKLSERSLKTLERLVDQARSDFRDVFAPAEFPGFCEVGFVGIGEMAEREVDALIDADWRQYQEWLDA